MKCKKFEYKGYITVPHFSKEDNLFFGKIENTRDLVSFHAEKLEEFEKEFQSTVEDYIEVLRGE